MDAQGRNSNEDKRSEPRIREEDFSFPFLGSRVNDHQSFQYILTDTSPQGAGIALPRWALSKQRLNVGDVVRLHAPLRSHDRNYDQGPVVWEHWDDTLDSQMCGVRLLSSPPLYYPVYIDMEKGKVEIDLEDEKTQTQLIGKILKDTYFLKRGVSIYLGHLLPFFSRVSGTSHDEFTVLRKVILSEVKARVEEHRDSLEKLWQGFIAGEHSDENAIASLDLEDYRSTIESEIDIDLLNLSLKSPIVRQQILAIKTVEQRLYYNYNTMVVIYLRSLLE